MKTKILILFLTLVASVGTMFASFDRNNRIQVGELYYFLDSENKTAEVTYKSFDSSSRTYNSDWEITEANVPETIIYSNETYQVISIGEHAFYDCVALTTVTIPNSVTAVGDFAFGLSVTFDGYDILTLPIYNKHIFAYLPKSYSGAYIIPDGIKTIAGHAFNACRNLTSIEIPNSITGIGNGAFYGCTGLTSIEIPNSVTNIGDETFGYCNGLTSVTISNSIIGNIMFLDCNNLTTVTLGDDVTNIGSYAFWNCTKLTNINLPNSVTNVGYCAFLGCTGMTSPIYNAHVFAFMPTSYSGAYTIPDGIESIAGGAFHDCSGLTSITIPNSVTSIGDAAFSGCYSLTSVNLPNSVTSIGGWAFSNCADLTSPVYNTHVFAYLPTSYSGAYTIPNGIESIADGAFSLCTGLTSISIPNSITGIGNGAFSLCTGLTSVKVPNSVTNVGFFAFQGCIGLTSVSLGNSVVGVGMAAFSGCDSIKSVSCFAAVPPTIDSLYAFDSYYSRDIPLYVPEKSVDAYKNAAKWNVFQSILPIEAKETETSTIKAEPTSSEVEVTWPVVAGAYTYELVIKDKSGNVICTLVFNAQGQLISIAFNAPERDGAPQQKQGAGFSFVVGGLDSGTEYSYDIIAKDENGNVLDTKSGSFTTQAPQGIDDINAATKSQKIVRDNQVFILRGEKTYTVTGQEVK